MKKFILTSIICLGVLTSSIAPASAATVGGETIEQTTTSGESVTSTTKDNDGAGAYGTVGSDLRIDVKATNVNVTVPTTAPFVFNEDGNSLVPTNFNVTNNSAIAGVYLESISLDSKTNGWKVVDDGFSLKTMPVDTKDVRIKFGKTGAERLIAPTSGDSAATGIASFQSGEIDIEAGQTQKLDFKVERGAFSKDIADATAFDMTLKFRFQ